MLENHLSQNPPSMAQPINALQPAAVRQNNRFNARVAPLIIDPAFTLDILATWQQKVAPLFEAQQHILSPGNLEDATLFQGGYGCGKTFTAVLFALQQAFMHPGSVGLIVGANQLALTDGIFGMVKEIAQALDLVAGQDYALRHTNKRILLKNGSIIYAAPAANPCCMPILPCAMG